MPELSLEKCAKWGFRIKRISIQWVTDHIKRLDPWQGRSRMDYETLKVDPRAYLAPELLQLVNGC